VRPGPDETKLRVVNVLATDNDDPDMHFTVPRRRVRKVVVLDFA
jgi:hypothetical protein